MYALDLKRKIWVVLALLAVALMVTPASAWAGSDDADSGTAAPSTNESSSDIIAKYLQATQTHDTLRNASMQVDIDASIVKLKEHGKLRALRKISRLGEVTYHVLFFQGDNTVKNDVIARYLEAERQGQGDQKLAISPDNYKFKFRGRKKGETGALVYVFQLSPKRKKVGLFKGEMWLDASTYLPVMEKGKLVKNPSIWFKKVEFERQFAIQNGISVPRSMNSTIDVRLIGTVDLQINYSNIVQNADAGDDNGGHAEKQDALRMAAAS
jgi:outer membrane lipoprotein-sorting protein